MDFSRTLSKSWWEDRNSSIRRPKDLKGEEREQHVTEPSDRRQSLHPTQEVVGCSPCLGSWEESRASFTTAGRILTIMPFPPDSRRAAPILSSRSARCWPAHFLTTALKWLQTTHTRAQHGGCKQRYTKDRNTQRNKETYRRLNLGSILPTSPKQMEDFFFNPQVLVKFVLLYVCVPSWMEKLLLSYCSMHRF